MLSVNALREAELGLDKKAIPTIEDTESSMTPASANNRN